MMTISSNLKERTTKHDIQIIIAFPFSEIQIGWKNQYYISNGYAVPITWEKKSETSQTVYKIKETGENLVVNDGNAYIQIYPTSGNMTIN